MKGGKLRIKLKQIVMAATPLMMIAIIILIASCCDDCPTCPGGTQSYRGYLYAADVLNGWIYQIDTESDSLIDSVNYVNGQQYDVGSLYISPNGKYLSARYAINYPENGQATIIYDAQNMNVVTTLQYSYVTAFIPDENIMLGFMNDSIHIYSLPDFTRIYTDTITSWLYPITDESKNLVYLYGTLKPESLDSTYIAAYDYKQRKVIDTWFLKDDRDSLVIILPYDIDLNKKHLICNGLTSTSLELYCYDLEERRLIYSTPITSRTGSMKISPDGQEVYVTDPGWPEQYSIPGIVFVYDANTGNYIDGISLYGLDDDPGIALFATPIVFTPTGEKAYVGSGRPSKGSGTISVIDTKERKVIKHIWPDKGHYFLYMCIGPKL